MLVISLSLTDFGLSPITLTANCCKSPLSKKSNQKFKVSGLSKTFLFQ
jgi:hypothetical protein